MGEEGMSAEEEKLSVRHRLVAAATGSVLTSLFVTPLDVVKVRLQSQATATATAKRPIRSLTPLDVVKTRLQAQTRQLRPGQCFLYRNGLMDHLCTYCTDGATTSAARHCEWFARPAPTAFRGTLDGLVNIARHEGLSSLWSGLSPTLVVAVPAVVGYFTLNDYLAAEGKRRMGDQFWVPMVAGATARSAIVVVTNPVEMIRTKLQSERLSYRDIGRAVRDSCRVEGAWALWKGLGPTLGRDVVFTAIYWGLLDRLRLWQIRREGRAESNFRISFSSGAVAGMVAAVVTNPLDVLKTQRQISLGQGSVAKISLGQLVTEAGMAGLSAGMWARVARVVPSCAIMIGTYDYLKAFFASQIP